MFGVCSAVCFLLLGAMLDATSILGGSTIGICTLQPLGVYPWQAYVLPCDGHWSTPGVHRVAAPSTTLSRGALCCSVCCTPAIPSIWWGIQLWGLGRELPNPLPSLHGGKGSSFPGLVPSNDQSTLNLQWALNLVILVW